MGSLGSISNLGESVTTESLLESCDTSREELP